MYTPEEKLRAVELFIKYDKSPTSVINELGYPCRGSIYEWYEQYMKHGEESFHKNYERYTPEQKQAAVDHYFEHGRCIARTRRMLGYPKSFGLLRKWLDELAPGKMKPKRKPKSYSLEEKKAAVIDLESRKAAGQKIMDEHGVSRSAIYKWKRELLGRREPSVEKNSDEEALRREVGKLEQKERDLLDQIYKLELERDILLGTAEILKKDLSADPKMMTNKEKTVLAGAMTDKYRLKDILGALGMPRSSYYYRLSVQAAPDKHADLRARVAEIFISSHRRYGYRRIHSALKDEGVRVSEKVVCRIMREDGLAAKRGKRRKYSSYVGEVGDAPANIVARNFHADTPNTLWLTDVTEFRIPAGKVYLSPIIDCFDGLVVAWVTSISPTADMANTMLKSAIATLGENEHPIIHSDRGGHYRWPEWVKICDKAGIIRSMSKKGCSPDNSAMEGFFGRMKVEMFYGESFSGWSLSEFMDAIDGYIDWYNTERIKESLGGMSPMRYRESLGLLAA